MGLVRTNKIILLVGPTATGKTKVSIELAHGIEHYLFDIVSLDDDYTLYDYQKDGRKLLDTLNKEKRNVIIVGGSGLYVKALLYNYKLEETKIKRIDYSNYTNEELKHMADNIDPNNDIHVNNRQRLERYITYYKETGNKITKKDEINERVYEFTAIGLKPNREELYDRINKRVDEMFKEGLLKEAKKLYKKNYKNFSNIIGYRELERYFKKEISLNEAKELIKQNTRKYAKRQFTWFNNQMKDITWFDVDYNNFDNTINAIKKFLV